MAGLTTLTDPARAAVELYADSLAALPLLLDKAEASGDILDIGSGGGFPGLVLACVETRHRYVLAERNGKKAAFLRHAVRALDLEHRVVVREEDVTRHRMPPGPFAVVTSKATFSDPSWLLLAADMLGPGGCVMWYAGQDAALPFGQGRGLSVMAHRQYTLGGLDRPRQVLLLTPANGRNP